ncbi:hypothetical protein [Caulobacter sp. 17J80-11]|uniref:hypothetical protein n=1 Tax=Caulobacter sp. 17J80-11 TaxID=2763502 RepID=UPI0016534DAD|nr:hypothetical protein [Caulobacter sp. 17J80-11]MBC6981060.1 hypothetical protein [Caulobacter sp. 17J80-11]
MSVRLLSAAALIASSLAFSAAAAEDAPAATSTAATSGAASATDTDPDKIICKTAKKTGTRLAKRTSKICKTKAEWDRIELENQLMNQDMQRSLGSTGAKG